MSRARRHHLVPAFYLDRFADEKGRIRRVDMSGSNRVMSIRDAAVETDFYTIQTGDGPSDAVEKQLSEIEGRAANALRAVDAGQLDPKSGALSGLVEFAAIQATRGRDFRDTMNDFTNQVAQMMFSMIESNQRMLERAVTDILGHEPTDEELQKYREDLARRDDFKVAMSDNAAVQAMLEAAAPLVPLLRMMSWHLLGVPSDSPLLVTLTVHSHSGLGSGPASSTRSASGRRMRLPCRSILGAASSSRLAARNPRTRRQSALSFAGPSGAPGAGSSAIRKSSLASSGARSLSTRASAS